MVPSFAGSGSGSKNGEQLILAIPFKRAGAATRFLLFSFEFGVKCLCGIRRAAPLSRGGTALEPD